MNYVLGVATGLVLSGLISQHAAPQGSAALADSGFRPFLPRFEHGISRFINGDPGPWLDNASRRDDATIMGAWGAYERGWKEAGPRYEWAAARFRESGATVNVDYLSSAVSGDVAYTVAIERSQVHLVGQEKPQQMALRTTHVFSREGGAWKLVHRHADPLIDKTAPGAVLRK